MERGRGVCRDGLTNSLATLASVHFAFAGSSHAGLAPPSSRLEGGRPAFLSPGHRGCGRWLPLGSWVFAMMTVLRGLAPHQRRTNPSGPMYLDQSRFVSDS
jgi:hypothetical protein